ncbi:pirin family protein [Maridesulfovibrio salexigens]|uniref:Pirin domain protein n=1 Tax=Maridesulfovibrio salexigens (strain ATCC 14822 / DSM 2638 / NCIMB 8403 / VKM B-1763) TaxID=526222 RepID=C6C011_MARSD|nr:pirin family protein [Maridesulfovibrio salexigens]ACS80882.1 Pirin domain protein [Maridesulfovibrio salexigens DSM 2638]
MRREIKQIFYGEPVHEGAGVKLHRAFGYFEASLFDPFLMLDDFRSDKPEDYLKGFPWHPHRGIETITYLLKGDVEHGDSLGNAAVTGAGSVQWMTAGSGIIHQEMPKGDENGSMHGFQLWANLSSENKMTDPEYREIPSKDIPIVNREDGTSIKIIAGKVDGTKGPAKGIGIDPEYLDVTVPADFEFIHPTKRGYTAFIYVTAGNGTVNGQQVENRSLVLFDDGDELAVNAGNSPISFLLLTGKPINEMIYWRGPIVMHTAEELDKAFQEYKDGTFIKHPKPQGL